MDVAAYEYSGDGIRTAKIVDGVRYEYILDGTQVQAIAYEKQESAGGQTDTVYYLLQFTYDESGSPASMRYIERKGATLTYRVDQTYYYVKNMQGDVVALTNAAGNIVATYIYDAWGNQTVNDYPGQEWIAELNPFRYRGYFYDTETGFYYLNSRYYNPEVGRFINADTTDVLSSSFDFPNHDKNLFAYCDNNPIVRADSNGQFWHIVGGAVIGGLIGGISSIVAQAVSGNGINWGEVGISAASGALTGAITAAAPGMGALATGLVHGAVGSVTYAATELVNGKDPTLEGVLVAGITAGVLAGASKGIGNKIANNAATKANGVGRSFQTGQQVGTTQIGVNPKTLIPNGRTLLPSKLAGAEKYGRDLAIDVYSNGIIYDGHHRVANAIRYGRSVDVFVRYR